MSNINSKVGITAFVEYESREHRGGGKITDGYIVSHRNTAFLRTNSHSNSLRIEISNLTDLPHMLASLALVPPDEDDVETVEEFTVRLKMRDDLATAFEKAALRLKNAARS